MKIFFRVDSGFHMGIGHVMRCLTLADVLKSRGHHITFISKKHMGNNNEVIRAKFPIWEIEGGVQKYLTDQEKLNYENWLGEDWESDLFKTNALIQKIGDIDFVIVDHYSLDERYEKKLFSKNVMVIDDLMLKAHSGQLLLNQNITANKATYASLGVSSRLLLGPQFALLRPEFSQMHQTIKLKAATGKIKRVLVFFGASDVNGDCLKLAHSIKEKLDSFEFTFVLSDKHVDYDALNNFLSVYLKCKLLSFVSNFSELMNEHDLFIGAGGTTSWERACLGVASALCSVADNQTAICEELGRQQICHYLGPSKNMHSLDWIRFFDEIVPESALWYGFRERSFSLVDGNGALKVAQEIENCYAENS